MVLPEHTVSFLIIVSIGMVWKLDHCVSLGFITLVGTGEGDFLKYATNEIHNFAKKGWCSALESRK